MLVKWVLCILVVFNFLTSCTQEGVVASVGDQKITKADVIKRLGMMKVLDPKTTEEYVLEELIRFKRGSLVLNARGIGISDAQIQARIAYRKKTANSDTKWATLIKKFESKPEFISHFILPEEVDYQLNKTCLNDLTFHKTELDKINQVLTGSQSDPSKLESLVRAAGSFSFAQGILGRTNAEIKWDQGRDLASSMSLSNEFLSPRLKLTLGTLQVNQVVRPEVWSPHNAYLLVRRDRSDDDRVYRFSLAVIQRKSCSPWIEDAFNQLPQVKYHSNK